MIGPSGLNMHGAIFASNPPAGLTAVRDDGSSTSTEFNAIFAALPHANTNTRTVFVSRPSDRYKIDARIDIVANGTQVFCDGVSKITLRNAENVSHVSTTPFFEGSGLSPHVRLEGVGHCRWSGGGWRGRPSQPGGDSDQTIYELSTGWFNHLVMGFVQLCETIVQVNGLGFGEWAEFCTVDSIHWRDGDGTSRRASKIGTVGFRSTSGKARGVMLQNVYVAGPSDGPLYVAAEDCGVYGGTSEYPGSQWGYELQAGCLRWLGLESSMEAVASGSIECQSGASMTAVGFGTWGTGAGDIYRVGTTN